MGRFPQQTRTWEVIIAVASGKGGTGKTTVSASLAHVWPAQVVCMDLDVEEPNLHLFLQPEIDSTHTIPIEVPKADESKCTYCRACADLCQFKAVSILGRVLLIFPEMCHGCGGCLAICPTGAIVPDERVLGEVCIGRVDGKDFIMGRLRVGEAMSPPLMRAVKSYLPQLDPQKAKDVIIDAPPGVSCPAVNAVMDSDVILLVTEPTPFGLYDLQLAVEAFSPLGKPMAVVINRAGIGDESIYNFCKQEKLPILANIPYQRNIAETYAEGKIVAAESTQANALFTDLARRVRQLGAIALENNCA